MLARPHLSLGHLVSTHRVLGAVLGAVTIPEGDKASADVRRSQMFARAMEEVKPGWRRCCGGPRGRLLGEGL